MSGEAAQNGAPVAPDNVNPVATPLSSRLAVPVLKREYIEGQDVSPGPPSFGLMKSDARFKTYWVYKFKVYAYDTYKDYFDATIRGDPVEPVKDKSGKAITFELSFNVQRPNSIKDENHKWKACIRKEDGTLEYNPPILQKTAQEVAITASAIAGKAENRGPGFAIKLVSLRKDGTYKTKKKKNKKGQYIDVGTFTNNLGYNSPEVAVHIHGPAGSEGCATTVDPSYPKMNSPNVQNDNTGLVAFEKYMVDILNLSPTHPARIVLPGTGSDPPYKDFTYWPEDEDSRMA